MAEPSIIRNQYREPGKGMVYELRCSEDAHLVLRAMQSLDPSAQWRFEARLSQMVLIGDWHATRLGAFHMLRELWALKSASLGLATFDWDKVASALQQVRALD
jgi:hypothetical protein